MTDIEIKALKIYPDCTTDCENERIRRKELREAYCKGGNRVKFEYESLPKIHGIIASCGTLFIPDYNIPETGRVLKEAGFRPGDKFEFLIRKI